MHILALNTIKLSPVFKSNKPKKEETAQNHSGQIPPNSFGMVYPADKSLLNQRFNFCGTKKEVDKKDGTRDSLTGFRNKQYLIESLDAAIQRAQKEGTPLSVAMLDLDDFKSVNELLGYGTGDALIKKIGGDIAEVAQKHNIEPYRFGGDEFFLIFDGESDSKKKEIANAIAEKVNSDDDIQSYRDTYIQNAEDRLNNTPVAVAKIYEILDLRHELKYNEKRIKKLTAEGNEINSKINEIYGGLIQDCMKKETDEENRAMLREAQKKLQTGVGLQGTEQQNMDRYLSSFYKRSDAEQINRWMYDFKLNNGFGFTCGVVNFDPEALKGKTAINVVEMAGKVLKYGKITGKGHVYFKDVKK